MDPKKSALTRKITAAKETMGAGAGRKLTAAKASAKKPASVKAATAKSQRRDVELKGTHRTVVVGAKSIGAVDPVEQAQITLRLTRKDSDDFEKRLADLTTKAVADRQYLTQSELADAHGAAEEGVALVDAFAHAHNLTVVETSLAKRTIKLQGSLADLQVAFGVQLKMFKGKSVVYRGRVGSIFIPRELAKVVEGVYGLDNRPAAKSHYRLAATAAPPSTPTSSPDKKKKKHSPPPPPVTPVSFTAPQVAALYNFPSQLNGKGQTIAIVELNTPNDPNQPTQKVGAGYMLSDLNQYFSTLGISPPQVTAISVDGGSNLPNLNLNADGEVELDIEVAGAVAPGANIAVYFAPNTDQGFIDALSAAVHDTVRKPSIVSVSWGGPEDFATQQFLDGINAVLQDAALLGVTVCVASGDSGSSDLDAGNASNPKYKGPHADFPASSPYALGCGGTRLIASQGKIVSEDVWNEGRQGGAGGGGISTKFKTPAWQSKVPQAKAGRGSPDVAGNADPNTGYSIVLQGASVAVGGTSAVAPLWAGLVALINQHLADAGKPPVGFLNSLLYGLPASAKAFHDITVGNNDIDGNLGKYSAGAGWDACTGLGSPHGAALLAALS